MNEKDAENLRDALAHAEDHSENLMGRLARAESQLDNTLSMLDGEKERCLGWQEHAKSLARTLEVISEFQNSLMKQAVIDNG